MGYTEQLDRLEAIRREALANRNAAGYRRLCDELGLNSSGIEDSDLYERGLSTYRVSVPPSSNVQADARLGYYQRFLEGVSDLRMSDLSADADSKRRLLRIFPRFRDGGQSINGLTDVQIGSLAQKIHGSALKYISKHKK